VYSNKGQMHTDLYPVFNCKGMIKYAIVFLMSLAARQSVFSQTFSLVKDIWPGNGAGVFTSNEFVVWNGKLYFTGRNGAAANGNELYVSDGTDPGTYMIKDLNPGTGAGGAFVLSLLNNQLVFFGGEAVVAGTELYKSDGTAAGTILVKDINPGTASSVGYTQATVNGYKYFDANTAAYGNELWKTDGTAAGTTMVKDINPAPGGSGNPREIRKVGNLLFFYADDGIHGQEVWCSDGTEAGTVMVKDIVPGSGGGQAGLEFADFNGIAYFRENDGVNGNELWRSDGTEAGTYMVKDINPGAGGSDAFNFIVFNNNLYFIATDGLAEKLWKTDGTSVGTVSLANAGGFYSTYGNDPGKTMAVCNGFLFFTGTNAANGLELWKTDGTIAGTTMVKDINAGAASTAFRDFITVNNTVIFNASTAAAGSEPWISDGTDAGTYMLQDIEPGSGSSTIGPFVIAGTKLFSVRTTTANGRELWVANNFVNLPLTFLSFTAQQCNSNVCLAWKTANEQNVSHFYIERSTDGINFGIVGRKNANNLPGNTYTATDDIALLQNSRKIYYRIREVDYDGHSKQSAISLVQPGSSGIMVYPTLVTSSFSIQNNSGVKMQLQLVSADGHIVLQQSIANGTNFISAAKLNSGVYIYKIAGQDGAINSTGSIIKQ